MEHDVAGGPGWIIRATDLRPVVTDLEAFRAGLTEDPLAEPIELLWTGNAGAALQMLEVLQQTPRGRALDADCHRDLGDTAHAVSQYDVLVAECAGTGSGWLPAMGPKARPDVNPNACPAAKAVR